MAEKTLEPGSVSIAMEETKLPGGAPQEAPLLTHLKKVENHITEAQRFCHLPRRSAVDLEFNELSYTIREGPWWRRRGETEWIPQPDLMADTYWSGSAPLCLGGCKARHQELRKDPCGDSSCCWLGYKSLCRVNCGRPDVDYNGAVYGNDWWVGSVVRYACHSGFILLGTPTRSCQSNGLWTPKPICLRMCQRGSIEVRESELNGTCDSTCENKSYFGPPKLGCSLVNNCRKKETGWKRFFTQCVPCICDCSLSCATAG